MTTSWPAETANCTRPGVDPNWFTAEATAAQRHHAQRTCIGCPAAQACLDTAREQHLIGWFAGRLITRDGEHDRPDLDPYAAAERAATPAQIRAAHNRHHSGARDDLTVALNREWDRRYRAELRASKKETAA